MIISSKGLTFNDKVLFKANNISSFIILRYALTILSLVLYLSKQIVKSKITEYTLNITKKHTNCVLLCFGNRHRHILPGRVQPSTFCATELNFCVRYGNRWDLSAIDTGIVEGRALLRIVHSQLHNKRDFAD